MPKRELHEYISEVSERGDVRVGSPLPFGTQYLQTLGITAVELMPVQEFNETSVTRRNPLTSEMLKNYWGYDPVAFFAPKASYSSSGGLGQQKLRFRRGDDGTIGLFASRI